MGRWILFRFSSFDMDELFFLFRFSFFLFFTVFGVVWWAGGIGLQVTPFSHCPKTPSSVFLLFRCAHPVNCYVSFNKYTGMDSPPSSFCFFSTGVLS